MITVSLNGVEFFAFHGFYPEEQLIGGQYQINVEVVFEPAGELAADELNYTVNYEVLYNICCKEMKKPRKLIETVANSIIDEIKKHYPFIERIDVSLKKMNPPMPGPVNYSAVNITYNKAATN
ncbi:dihydroneopterin aldolase [Mucilaginibacter sp. UR6-1]|uniref:dihydroneopterin aldolase n=1 Tax=Mucilaginibacter sp. UR6-1 TaxID=1435643 RepID=UPI001E37E10B|nr:dihydroneopterin aldolase [Mucilaginibacter sp. UR6-1]MCC8408074.1 dihydroneopterin aldolase [Mucilaginibacter sp. UR6-1]